MFLVKNMSTYVKLEKKLDWCKKHFFHTRSNIYVAHYQGKIPKRLGSMRADIMKVDPISEIVGKYNPNLQPKLKKSC